MPGPPPATRWPRGPAATARTAPGPARGAGRAQSGAEPWRRRRQETQSAAPALGCTGFKVTRPSRPSRGPPCREGAGQGWGPAQAGEGRGSGLDFGDIGVPTGTQPTGRGCPFAPTPGQRPSPGPGIQQALTRWTLNGDFRNSSLLCDPSPGFIEGSPGLT